MKPPAERLAWAEGFCAQAQLRLTTARRRILDSLSRHALPANMEALKQSPELRGHCDATTVYRTLMLLKELGAVRQVSVRHGVRHFILNVPGETCAYLICRCCGSVTGLPELRSVLELERHVTDARRYIAVSHELEVHGVCPQCQQSGRWSRPAAKLPIRV